MVWAKTKSKIVEQVTGGSR